MPRSLAHFGPVEFEQDIQQDPPAERLEHFLCVVLGLLLNRKQDIKLAIPSTFYITFAPLSAYPSSSSVPPCMWDSAYISCPGYYFSTVVQKPAVANIDAA